MSDLYLGNGCFKPQGVEVIPLTVQPDGIRQGDLVVAVEGQSLASWAQKLFQPAATRPTWQVGQVVTYTVLRDGQSIDIPMHLDHYPLGMVLVKNWSNWLVALILEGLAAFILVRRPENRAVRVLFLWMTCFVGNVVFWTLGLQVSDIVHGGEFWLQTLAQHISFIMFCSGLLHFTLIFPTIQFRQTTYRWLIPALYVFPLLVYLLSGMLLLFVTTTVLDWAGRWVQVHDILGIVLLAIMIVTIILGFRQTKKNSITRQRSRLAVVLIVFSGTILLFTMFTHFINNGAHYSANSLNGLLLLLGLLFPLTLMFAITRDGLFRIRFIINRTLVYVLLTISIIGMYVLIVGALGQLFQSSGSPIISLLATGLIAAVAQPLRERLQNIVNRFMYGERDDPYIVLDRLGARLEGTLEPQSGLSILVATVAESLKLPYAAIELKQADTFVVAARYGTTQSEVIRLPIFYQRDLSGQLVLAPRAPGELFSKTDHHLLDHLAQQAGVVVHTVRLTADLQRSREQLVTTREEERRRLRRDLHDGLGPMLASILLKVDASRNLLERDWQAADKLLSELGNQTETIIAEIRRLVYELRPPALDELGLIPALRQFALYNSQTSGVQIAIEAPDSLQTLPAALEVAIYRVVLEAITNVIRHAHARTCLVNLVRGDGLSLEISDDGRGLVDDHKIGVGLHSMRERATELVGTLTIDSKPAGGTRILVQLPLTSQPLLEA